MTLHQLADALNRYRWWLTGLQSAVIVLQAFSIWRGHKSFMASRARLEASRRLFDDMIFALTPDDYPGADAANEPDELIAWLEKHHAPAVVRRWVDADGRVIYPPPKPRRRPKAH